MVGTYQLGYRWVELWHRPLKNGFGGSFQFTPETNGNRTHTCILMDFSQPQDTAWEILLHELVEGTMHDLELSYKRAGRYTNNTESFHFFFNHQEYTEVMGRVGSFMGACAADFIKTWLRFHPTLVAKQK